MIEDGWESYIDGSRLTTYKGCLGDGVAVGVWVLAYTQHTYHAHGKGERRDTGVDSFGQTQMRDDRLELCLALFSV
jgi:hypothetical protein